MVDLQVLIFSVGLFVSIIAAGGVLFTIREFKRFDRESQDAVEDREGERASVQGTEKQVAVQSRTGAEKFIGADI